MAIRSSEVGQLRPGDTVTWTSERYPDGIVGTVAFILYRSGDQIYGVKAPDLPIDLAQAFQDRNDQPYPQVAIYQQNVTLLSGRNGVRRVYLNATDLDIPQNALERSGL